MDYQSIISYLLGAVSGLMIAVLKAVPRIVEDVWTDYRQSRNRIAQDKNSLVTQLLFDLPKGKAKDFYFTTVKKSEGEHLVARISKYDKQMAKTLRDFLYLWTYYATTKREFETNGEVIVIGDDDEPDSKGPLYVEEVLDRLNHDYETVIDLLNKWKA